ncbi:MAG: hypothetical protein PF574_02300 [Candidatus Delongbacteria bacterium]|jgi:hypothetical protein|nr:hypothetical protein [Candidatus Delongbacteria bacterium]
MKRFLLVIMMITTIKAFGFFGFGIHAGVDNTSVDKFSAPFNFDIAGNAYEYEITRDKISNPFVFGGQVYLDVPLVPIGFEAGFEASWASYKWTAPANITSLGATPDIPLEFTGYDAGASGYSEEFTFGRFSTDFTAKWYVFGFPPVVKIFSFYVGGGAGFHFITPLVSENLIIAELEKTTNTAVPAELDIEELVKSNVSMGYHIVTGARIKFPVLPIAFNVDYKWTWTGENDYGDDTNNFGMIKGSASIYF